MQRNAVMIRCPVCHSTYSGLACEPCTLARSRKAFLEQQKLFLPAVLAGDIDVTFVRLRHHEEQHLQLISESSRSFCWKHLDRVAKKERKRYSPEARGAACAECLATLDALAGELRKAPV